MCHVSTARIRCLLGPEILVQYDIKYTSPINVFWSTQNVKKFSKTWQLGLWNLVSYFQWKILYVLQLFLKYILLDDLIKKLNTKFSMLVVKLILLNYFFKVQSFLSFNLQFVGYVALTVDFIILLPKGVCKYNFL